MLGTSFLRLGFSDIYIILSIGTSIIVPLISTVFRPVVAGRGSSKTFFGPLGKEKCNEEY